MKPNGLDYVLSTLSTMEGVEYIDVQGAPAHTVYVYVRSVEELFPTVSRLFKTHAPDIRGQVRGPQYPVKPPRKFVPRGDLS